jgi:1,4-dihydroxy-2-naphthoyl-CoA hydrolase
VLDGNQNPDHTEEWNAPDSEYLPGHMGFTFVKVEPDEAIATLAIRKAVRSWNGYLHAGTVATLADICCGYGTMRGLPEGATISGKVEP